MTGVLRPVCGCAPVRVLGVENYDVTHLLNSHADYCLVVGEILRLVRHGQPRPTAGTGFHGNAPPKDEEESSSDDDATSDDQSASVNGLKEPFIAPLGDEKVR